MKHLTNKIMKGYLNKIEEWFVIFDQRTMQDPSAEDGMLPLHPHDIAVSSFSFHNGKEVEFEINMYDGKSHISNAWNGYAKLIDHIVDTNEMVNQVTDVEQLAEDVYGKGVKEDYEEGFVDGYNKAKETLYTKEQMELCWIAAMSNRAGFSDSISYKEFIQSLKQ